MKDRIYIGDEDYMKWWIGNIDNQIFLGPKVKKGDGRVYVKELISGKMLELRREYGEESFYEVLEEL